MVGERVVVGDKEMTAAQLVERLGFTRQRAWTRVGEVSGGERRRLQLLRLLMTEPNVLLLDAATNASTPTPWPPSRTSSTPSPAPSWSSPTTATSWNG